jgi:hypothetical protein
MGLRVSTGVIPFGGVDSKDTLDTDSGKSSIEGHMERFPGEVSTTVPLSTDETAAERPRREQVC